MFSFRSFLLFEAGDSPYAFKEVSKRDQDTYGSDDHPHTAVYRFKDEVGTPYFANVIHYNDKHAEVSFGTHENDDPFVSPYELRRDKGLKAARIMSTVHHIIKRHAARHPLLNTINFTSDIIEPSRVKLYTNYTKRLGGTTNDSEQDIYSKIHTIPAASYRK